MYFQYIWRYISNIFIHICSSLRYKFIFIFLDFKISFISEYHIPTLSRISNKLVSATSPCSNPSIIKKFIVAWVRFQFIYIHLLHNSFLLFFINSIFLATFITSRFMVLLHRMMLLIISFFSCVRKINNRML